MKVLWFCNCPLVAQDEGGGGTWLQALGERLGRSPLMKLGVVAPAGVLDVTQQNFKDVEQWLVPSVRRGAAVCPPQHWARQVLACYDDFKPDLIHIWGTESQWGKLSADGAFNVPVLLNMQGLMASIGPAYAGGLSCQEQLGCIGIKEAIRWETIGRKARRFGDVARRERLIISAHDHIACPSPWVEAHVRDLNPRARVYRADCAAREPFLQAPAWEAQGQYRLFFCATGPLPYKGLHVAVRAMPILRRVCPHIRLRVAGRMIRHGLRRDGYIAWVERLARRLGVADSIDWLGALDGPAIVTELHMAAAAIIPTFVESYCLAMAEAMCVGTPVVASFTGGTSHLGCDGQTCLFFQPGDVAMLAYQVIRLLESTSLARSISAAGRRVALSRHCTEQVAGAQLTTYQQMLAEQTHK